MNENQDIDQPTLPVFTCVKGQRQFVGTVQGIVHYKRVHGSLHFLHDFNAIGISTACLREAERLGATKFEILDLDTSTTYSTNFVTMRERGFVRNFGHGEQLFLNFRWWSINGAPPTAFAAVSEPSKSPTPAAPVPVQATLAEAFEGEGGGDD